MQKERKNVVPNKIIPELVSGSSTHAVTQQPALKTLKKFQGLSNFSTARAFTLIELLVVVLIIGILAAVALPQYQKAVYKSKVMQVLPYLHAIKTAEEVYYLENGTYTNQMENLSITVPSPNDWTCDLMNLGRMSAECRNISLASLGFDFTVNVSFDLRHEENDDINKTAGKIYCWANVSEERSLNLCKSFGPKISEGRYAIN